uniref:Oxidoreductase FAD/NAD(P)-binding domain-containing protein n=2 Tax=Spongospora subterranea TaxID=70186 RepID=A0A0H5QJE9_9EUKA|eukprot:CRZ01431.1 hypothetical protein [Spongospora subterranea]
MERLRENFTNITDIFAQYSSARPTANELCDLLPPLALRYYSIASSPFRHPSTVHLTVAISEHAKQLVPSCSSFRGLCTYWLETCHLGRCTDSSSLFKIPLFIRHNRQLRLPPLDRLPSLVMIGCGVGVAPFRSFLQHLPEGSRQVFLFFGFRDNKDEFLYQREWETSQAITRIDLAFSRIDSHPYRYVQDALKARSEEVAGLISSNAIFYVCGTLSMATAVFECFISDILGRTGGLSRAQAIEVMENKIHQGKYMAEAWD